MELKKNILEFLLWDNCNNNCKFCFQRKNSIFSSLEEQKNILNNVLQYLNGYPIFDTLILMGGEIFDDKKRIFLPYFFNELSNLLVSGKFKKIGINSNLIYNENCLKNFISVIDIFNNKEILNKITITVSYDKYGRYKSIKDEKLFFSNLSFLQNKYSNLNINCNIILTNQICQDILNDSFDVKKFCDEKNVNVILLPYIILNQSLTPEKVTVFNTLLKVFKQDPVFFKKYLKTISSTDDRLVLKWNKSNWKNITSSNLSCGHSFNFSLYSKKNTCFICDILKIFEYE